MDFLTKLSSTIKKYNMLSGGERVLVGLSGGPDSVCLTLALKELGVNVNSLYVDHGLRPDEVPGEISFCENFCNGIGVPFSTTKIDVKGFAEQKGMNLQEAARELRYWALDDSARRMKADRIALGHNMDDQVETLLMHLLRGSGRRGLSAIPPVRGTVVRPLIETTRDEIMEYLMQEGAGFVTDSSNLKQDYTRNRLRSVLMPALKEFNPNIIKTLAHTAEVFRDEERYLDVATTKAMMKLITRKDPNTIELFLTPLENMDRVILRRVLRRAVKETEGLRGVGFIHIEDIIGLVREGEPGDRISLPHGVRAVKNYSTLLITSAPPERVQDAVLEGEGSVVMKEIGEVLEASLMDTPPDNAGEMDCRRSVLLDAAKAVFPLTVRARREGDFFYPQGFGKRKKLQDFFVDEKIPRDERDAVPVVTSGDDVVWVAGYRADERYGVTGDTDRFLLLRLIKAAR